MNLSEIAPTKTNLLEFKDQLNFSKDGHELLEQKREVLVLHLMDIISKIRQQRERLNDLLAQSYQLLRMLEIEIGEFELLNLIKGIQDIEEIRVMEKSIMGVAIPTIKHKKQEKKSIPAVSLSSTSVSFDELSKNLSEIMELIFIVAQTEVAAWRLSYEIKKTQRRVNALENIFIPEFEEIVKYIQDTLEERERETLFQMKQVKKKTRQEEKGENRE